MLFMDPLFDVRMLGEFTNLVQTSFALEISEGYYVYEILYVESLCWFLVNVIYVCLVLTI